MLALVILMLVSAAASAPLSEEDVNARIVRYDNANDGSGNYHFRFETSNGLTREETGRVVNPGMEDEHIQVQGFYRYFDEMGVPHTVYYTADKDGYRIVKKPKRPQTNRIGGAALATLLG